MIGVRLLGFEALTPVPMRVARIRYWDTYGISTNQKGDIELESSHVEAKLDTVAPFYRPAAIFVCPTRGTNGET